jgi:hypothetical protein
MVARPPSPRAGPLGAWQALNMAHHRSRQCRLRRAGTSRTQQGRGLGPKGDLVGEPKCGAFMAWATAGLPLGGIAK